MFTILTPAKSLASNTQEPKHVLGYKTDALLKF